MSLLAAVWTGAGNASDIFLLIAAIVAVLAFTLDMLSDSVQASLLPLAVGLVALGLLAL